MCFSFSESNAKSITTCDGVDVYKRQDGMNMFLASPDNNGLCTKETAVTKVVTATRLIPATSAHMLVNGGDRYTRASFIEAWLYAHVGEIRCV